MITPSATSAQSRIRFPSLGGHCSGGVSSRLCSVLSVRFRLCWCIGWLHGSGGGDMLPMTATKQGRLSSTWSQARDDHHVSCWAQVARGGTVGPKKVKTALTLPHVSPNLVPS